MVFNLVYLSGTSVRGGGVGLVVVASGGRVG